LGRSPTTTTIWIGASMVEEPPINIILSNNIHKDIKELSNDVLYALRTKQLTVSHIIGGIINERLIDKEHYIEDQGHFFTPDEKIKHEAILDTLLDIMIMLNDLEWLADRGVDND